MHSVETAEVEDLKRAKARQKRKERKKRWRARRNEREAHWHDVDDEDAKYGDELEPYLSIGGSVAVLDAPARLILDGARARVYASRLTEIQRCGGYVSVGTYRKLDTLIGEEMRALILNGQDPKSLYRAAGTITMRIVECDDDVPCEESDRSDDDMIVQ